MNVRPLHDYILVKVVEEGEEVRGGIVIPDTAKERPQQGEVVAVGPGKKTDDGKLVPLDVKVGDRILFSKYGGSELPRSLKIDSEEHLLMHEGDVLAVLEPSKAESAKVGAKK
ncbi:MAG: co-chaperone GroES [Acidobacteria bacterium]|nr:co-chaperone GroES [Acidobacteriota bacterium]